MGAHRPAPRIQDDHELDSDITLFSHYLIENPLNPRVFGSWIRSSEAGLGRHMRRIHELSISELVEDTGLGENTIRSKDTPHAESVRDDRRAAWLSGFAVSLRLTAGGATVVSAVDRRHA